jgi:hypothetical protein
VACWQLTTWKYYTLNCLNARCVSAAARTASKTGKGKKGSKGAGSKNSSNDKSGQSPKPHTGLGALQKALFDWMDPKVKKNGKKLLGSNAVTWRFVVSCDTHM